MTTLEQIWENIQPRVPEGTSHFNTVAESFLFPWNHDDANMDMIVQALEIYKPKVAIELGTFEGWGMERIATSMVKTGGGKLFTFDAGKAPFNSLGPTYGVTEEYIKETYLVDWEHIPFEGWKSFGKVILKRQERLDRLKITAPNVEITFIEGITYDTLPVWMPKIGIWDFLFQDTMHELHSIIKEWKSFSPYSKVGSLVVFDDIYTTDGVEEYFRREEPNWKWIYTTIGRNQLWGERRI